VSGSLKGRRSQTDVDRTNDTSFVAEPPPVESTTPAPPTRAPARRVPAVRGGRGRVHAGSGIARGRGSGFSYR